MPYFVQDAPPGSRMAAKSNMLLAGCRRHGLPDPKLQCGRHIRVEVCGIMSLEWKAFSNVSGAKSYVWRLSS